jgi:hypothetical protein
MFTFSEYFDMLVLYGQCDESATVAAQEYYVQCLLLLSYINCRLCGQKFLCQILQDKSHKVYF